MARLTDAEIRRAIKRTEATGKQETLTDGEGRGTGRLVLLVKRMPTRVTADWYAQQWRSGRRTRAKIGTYPAMTLAGARERFQADYATAIQKGSSVRVVSDSEVGTVDELFKGYVAYLRAEEKPSASDIERELDKVAEVLGADRPARSVTPDDVVAALRPIFERGSASMADHVRSYVHAAFNWGIKAERDYRRVSTKLFRIAANPATGIPSEPKKAGNRWLRPEEFVQLYRWLQYPDRPVHPPYTHALRVLMLTGQRVQEIAALHADQWCPEERMIDWSQTKNGIPHAIPVPDLAAEILDNLEPSRHGWLFPSQKDPSRSVHHGTLYAFVWRQRDRGIIPMATNRDLRRTWKTLAGDAGLSKEIRDRLQNHSISDISTRHYDRYNMIREKREAMDVWNDYVVRMLEKHTAPVSVRTPRAHSAGAPGSLLGPASSPV